MMQAPPTPMLMVYPAAAIPAAVAKHPAAAMVLPMQVRFVMMALTIPMITAPTLPATQHAMVTHFIAAFPETAKASSFACKKKAS